MVAKKRLDVKVWPGAEPNWPQELEDQTSEGSLLLLWGGAPCVPSAGVRLPAIGATSSIVTLG